MPVRKAALRRTMCRGVAPVHDVDGGEEPRGAPELLAVSDLEAWHLSGAADVRPVRRLQRAPDRGDAPDSDNFVRMTCSQDRALY